MIQVHDRRHQHYRSIDFDFYRCPSRRAALTSQARCFRDLSCIQDCLGYARDNPRDHHYLLHAIYLGLAHGWLLARHNMLPGTKAILASETKDSNHDRVD